MGDAIPSRGVSEPAPAKVNLYLHVGVHRPDGFHDLESAVLFTAFGDKVRVAAAETLDIERRGTYAGALPDEAADDLCCRAAAALAASLGRLPNLKIDLLKNIPVAAGLGGGSADAAAVLRALCGAWQIAPDDYRVLGVAEGLGADVPVCLVSRPSFVSGTGEQLQPAEGVPVYDVLLVNPGIELSTASVFGAFEAPGDNTGLVGPIDFSTGIDAIRHATRNDLEQSAVSLCPVIADVLEALAEVPGCRLARMSGSGPTCFGIFESTNALTAAADTISAAHPDWWVCPTQTLVG